MAVDKGFTYSLESYTHGAIAEQMNTNFLTVIGVLPIKAFCLVVFYFLMSITYRVSSL